MKRLMKAVLLGVLLCLLVSCATTVHVRHLVPGEVDLKGERNLAIASTSRYRFSYGRPVSPWVSGLQETDFALSSGFEANLTERVASLATQMIVEAVQGTRYFSILLPEATDAYLSLARSGENSTYLMRERGFTMLLNSEISYMDMDERVESVDHTEFVTDGTGVSLEQVTRREYYLVQEATLSLFYTISSLEDGRVMASENLTDKAEQRTKIGTRYYETDGSYRDERDYNRILAPSFDSLFVEILDECTSRMALQLAPSWESEHLSLMKNKPKLAAAEIAHKDAENREYRKAYEEFLGLWQQNQHVSSGYNAALMLAGLGELQDAVDLMNEVYNVSGNKRAYDTLLVLQEALSQDQLAQRQISGESVDDGQGVTMTHYLVME
ncbi:MAG: hypothetical protein ACQ5SW_07410 [Sphaerochaetaceae bacterium]